MKTKVAVSAGKLVMRKEAAEFRAAERSSRINPQRLQRCGYHRPAHHQAKDSYEPSQEVLSLNVERDLWAGHTEAPPQLAVFICLPAPEVLHKRLNKAFGVQLTIDFMLPVKYSGLTTTGTGRTVAGSPLPRRPRKLFVHTCAQLLTLAYVFTAR
ncbi:uncharacterized protein LOC142582356 [Dermacentor variabilis]|uniref:uncharacterized protein LOC142582356 n=1 Tax=Dermacentor variabilis TaxID=34621 RepID=UPI003F5BC1A0